MSKLQQKIQRARSKGVYVFKWPSYKERRRAGDTTWVEDGIDLSNGRIWAVYAEGEFYPRVGFTKREAVNLAYAISIAKQVEIEVTYG